MTEHRAGWYWAKPPEDSPCVGWGVAYWTGLSWYFRAPWGDVLQVGEVGPRIPTPDEPWQCVPKEPTESMASALRTSDSGGVDHWAVDRVKRILAAAPSPDDSA